MTASGRIMAAYRKFRFKISSLLRRQQALASKVQKEKDEAALKSLREKIFN